jgi:hypothetical protein
VHLAFGLVKLIVDSQVENLVHIVIESKQTVLLLFHMLDAFPDTTDVQVIRNVVSSIHTTRAENCSLSQAVEKLKIRSEATAGFAGACLADEHRDGDEIMSARLASLSWGCIMFWMIC